MYIHGCAEKCAEIKSLSSLFAPILNLYIVIKPSQVKLMDVMKVTC